jgi:hypothetical protein
MAHFHSYNPWAHKLVYISSIAEAIGLAAETRIFNEYGIKLDAYILRQPSGWHSFGIRYGKEPYEYLSPSIDPEIAKMLLNRHEAKLVETKLRNA